VLKPELFAGALFRVVFVEDFLLAFLVGMMNLLWREFEGA
jgi:hypothetical protein